MPLHTAAEQQDPPQHSLCTGLAVQLCFRTEPRRLTADDGSLVCSAVMTARQHMHRDTDMTAASPTPARCR